LDEGDLPFGKGGQEGGRNTQELLGGERGRITRKGKTGIRGGAPKTRNSSQSEKGTYGGERGREGTSGKTIANLPEGGFGEFHKQATVLRKKTSPAVQALRGTVVKGEKKLGERGQTNGGEETGVEAGQKHGRDVGG